MQLYTPHLPSLYILVSVHYVPAAQHSVQVASYPHAALQAAPFFTLNAVVCALTCQQHSICTCVHMLYHFISWSLWPEVRHVVLMQSLLCMCSSHAADVIIVHSELLQCNSAEAHLEFLQRGGQQAVLPTVQLPKKQILCLCRQDSASNPS